MTRTRSVYDGFERLHRRLVCGAALSGVLALSIAFASAPALASEPAAVGEPAVAATAQPAKPTPTGQPTDLAPSELGVPHNGSGIGADGVSAPVSDVDPETNAQPSAPAQDGEAVPADSKGTAPDGPSADKPSSDAPDENNAASPGASEPVVAAGNAADGAEDAAPSQADAPEAGAEPAAATPNTVATAISQEAAPEASDPDVAEKPAWLQGETMHISAETARDDGAVFAGQRITISVTFDADDPSELPELGDVFILKTPGLQPDGDTVRDGATFSQEFLVTEDVPINSYIEISVAVGETLGHAESYGLDIETLHRAERADYTAYLALRDSIDEDSLHLYAGGDELLEALNDFDENLDYFLNLTADEQYAVDVAVGLLQDLKDSLVLKTQTTLDISFQTQGVGPGGTLDVFVAIDQFDDESELPESLTDSLSVLASIGDEPLGYIGGGEPSPFTNPSDGRVGYLASFAVPADAPLGATIDVEAILMDEAYTSPLATATTTIAVADVTQLQQAVSLAAELIYGQGGTDFTSESRDVLKDEYLGTLILLSSLSNGVFVMPENPEDVDAINTGLTKLGAEFQPLIDRAVQDLNDAMSSMVYDVGAIIIAPQAKTYDGTATFAGVKLMGIPGIMFEDAGRISGIAQVSSADAGTYTEVVIPHSELAISGDDTDRLWAALDTITDEDNLIHASGVSFTIEKAAPKLSVSMPAQVTAGESFQVSVTMNAPTGDPDGMGLPAPEQLSIAVDGATGDGVITKEGCTYVATFTADKDAAGATLTATARVLDGATNYVAGGDATATAVVKAAPEQPSKPDEGDKEPQPGTTTPSDDKKDEPKKEQLPKTGDESLNPAVVIGVAAGGVALAGAGAVLIARSRKKDRQA